MALPRTGATNQGAIVLATPISLAVPRVLKSELADADHPVNDSHIGGKAPGAVYIAHEVGAGGGEDVYTLITAAGTLPTDDWIVVGVGTGSGATLAPVVYVTPA